MNTSLTRSTPLSWALGLSVLVGGFAAAQQPTSKERDALEPAAQSSVSSVAAPAPAPAASAAEVAAPARAASTAPAPKKTPRAATARSGTAAQHSATASDRIDLDAETVTGNQELPKVMYVVPWKKSEIGDVAGRPMNSLLDEVLAPVDRDVFRREVGYYDAVKSESSPSGGSATGSGKPR